MDAHRRAQVGIGAELALIERSRRHAEERPGDGEERRRGDGAAVDPVRHHQHDAGQPDQDAELLRARQAHVQPDGDHHRGQQGLQGQDQRRHAGREPPALGIVAAAQIAGMRQQSGQGDMAPRRPCLRPGGAQPEGQHRHGEGDA